MHPMEITYEYDILVDHRVEELEEVDRLKYYRFDARYIREIPKLENPAILLLTCTSFNFSGDFTLYLKKSDVLDVIFFLRDSVEFQLIFVDSIVCDLLEGGARFTLNYLFREFIYGTCYQLYFPLQNHFPLNESLCSVYPSSM